MKYKIKPSSPLLRMATFLIVVFLGIEMFSFLSRNQILPEGKPVLVFLYFTPILVFAFYLRSYTATAEIEISIDDDGIKRTWLRQFFLHNKQDDSIKWNDIDNYVHQTGSAFDQFKLNLKDGTKFKLHHDKAYEDKDDFKKFFSDFVQKVEQINHADKDERNDIKLGKSIYERVWGLMIAIVAVTTIVGVSIMFFVLPNQGDLVFSNYVMLAALYIAAIYLVNQVYIHRKRRKVYENSLK